jgi:hypothetical protein
LVATPGKVSPWNFVAPVESLISMLCGTDASSLSKSMTNALSAGAVTVGVVNVIPDAVTLTSGAFAAPEAVAAGDPDGAPDGAPDPAGVLFSSDHHAGKGVAPAAGL